MDDELTPEQRFAAEDAETLVPRALLWGKKPEDVVADLVKLDWSRAAAESLVARVIKEMRQFRASAESRKRLIDRAYQQFILGLILASGGAGILGVAFGTSAAGLWLYCFYLVPFGIFIVGIALAGRGWARWRLYRGWAQHLERANEMRKSGDI
jgi:hypothetical protein